MPISTTNMDSESPKHNSVYANYWRTWDRVLTKCMDKPDDEFHKIFENFVSEGAAYCMPHGLDKTEWADRVQDMAMQCGFVERFGNDDLQELLARKIASAEAKIERVPDVIEAPKANGHDKMEPPRFKLRPKIREGIAVSHKRNHPAHRLGRCVGSAEVRKEFLDLRSDDARCARLEVSRPRVKARTGCLLCVRRC